MNIVDIAIKRPVTVWMFTSAVVLFGLVSLSRLTINLLPELTYPTLTIRTQYEGAAPAEVEQLVSKPIEEVVGVVKGVREVTSISKAGQSDVILQFQWGTRMDLAGLDIREKLDVLQLPLDVTKPLLLRFNPNMDPIVRIGLGAKPDVQPRSVAVEGDNDDPASATDPAVLDPQFGFATLDIDGLKRLREFADEQLKRALESVEGVASVKVGGGLEKEIQVLLDQQKASQFDISIEQVVSRLQEENVNAAGGRLEDGSQEYLVRTLNQFSSLRELGNVFIATRDGKNIQLADIATIGDSYKERSAINRFDGLEGVEIAVYKEGDANTVEVANKIKQRLANMQDDIPSQYQVQIVSDQANFIANAIDEVKLAAISGGVLAMLVLYFFLKNIWATLIVSISIPVSIIATFNLMYHNQISLNIMSLGGIALAIGLLVDNSIVVLENIDRTQRQKPQQPDPASRGTKEVALAILASTLTTIAVFFPLVFVEGIAGQLFKDQALTVTYALIASLLVAMTIIPMMSAASRAVTSSDQLDLGDSSPSPAPDSLPSRAVAALTFIPRLLVRLLCYYLPLITTSLITAIFRALRNVLGVVFTPLLVAFDTLYDGVANSYHRVLAAVLKYPLAVISAIVSMSLLSLLLLPKLGIELIPDMAQGEFNVAITLPAGSRLESTDAVLAGLADYTQQLPAVERTFSLAGTGSLMNASPDQGGDNWGQLDVVLATTASAQDELRVRARMREYMQTQAGVQAKFGKTELFSFTTPVEIELTGYDLTMLARYSDLLTTALLQRHRFADVKSSLQSGNPELRIYFDHGKLAQLGLTAPQVASLISAKIGGETASKYAIDDRKVDILVRVQAAQRDSQTDIARMIVNPGAARPVTLEAVADIRTAIGPSEITRVGQERVAIISANLAYGDLGEAVAEIEALLPTLDLPLTVSARVTGQNEEMQVSFQSLQFALLLAVFMVYIVMASQFESLLHPLLILFTVPLACAGSIYGLFLTGTTVSVVVFIGLIMLAGIVVNNAIVLIDRINQNRAKGSPKLQAIVEAAESRLRPILMTTLTTALGLLPMIVGMGDGAELRKPMAVTVIFGLLYASLLTLVLIPALYSAVVRNRDPQIDADTATTLPQQNV